MAPVQVGDQLPELNKPVVIQLLRSRSWSGRNPIHWDPEYAQEKGLRAPAATGMMTQAYLGEMCMIHFGEALFHNSQFDVKFVRPVHPDDLITTHGEVEAVEPLDDGHSRVSARVWCTNQEGATVTTGSVQVTLPND